MKKIDSQLGELFGLDNDQEINQESSSFKEGNVSSLHLDLDLNNMEE